MKNIPHIALLHSFRLLATVVALVSLAAPATAEEGSDKKPEAILVTPSAKPFAQTLRAFQDEVAKAGWSVLHVNNIAGVLSERGFTVHPVVILDVCSGSYSTRILSKDEYRSASAMMPCRVSIYQSSDGKVFVARMDIGGFAALMPPEVASVMAGADEAIGKMIEAAVR